MNVSLQWLGDHLDLSDYSAARLDELLTFAGIEVEDIRHLPEKLVVAEVLSSEKHPDADKLSVCRVDDGSGEVRQIVCGAKNYAVGDKVPLALPGCVLGAGGENPFEIREGELRGVASAGMLCSGSEIGLGDDADGLLILPADLEPGTPLSEIHPAVFELEITPNRPDCLSHLGVARELAALSGKALRGPAHRADSATPVREAKEDEIRIESDACPYYTLRRIRGVTVGESPDWLRERLESIGLRPVNNVVDVTNYVLFEMGQPLHAFDEAALKGGIRVRAAEAGERFAALDGETYELTPDDLVIADGERAVAVGGAMGGADTGVTGSTSDLVLESAYFSPPAVRRTAQRLGLHSDSSYRFERGVDPLQVNGASDLAVRWILELAGGEAEEELVICGELPARPAPVELDNDYCRAVMGTEIADETIDGILSSLGLEKVKGAWHIPSYRLDLERPVDLVEEVARVHGLEDVPATRSAWFSEASKADAAYDVARSVGESLAALGFYETRNLELLSEGQLADDFATERRGLEPLQLANPLNDEQDWLRPGLVPGLLACAERNRRFGNGDLRLFEMGRVFLESPDGGEVEREHLALLMTGARVPRGWANGKPESIDIHDLRAVLERVGPAGLRFEPVEDDRLVAACRIQVGTGKEATRLGLAGIVPPARAREADLAAPVVVAELDRPALAGALSGGRVHAELPRFPGSSRDVAMEVPADLPAGRLAEFFESWDEPLLRSVELFDLFRDPEGEKLPADRKSLAYSLTYRADERTLEAAEVEEAHGKLLDSLKREFDVEFR